MSSRICDCENENCRAGHAMFKVACQNAATVSTIFNRVCASCAAFMAAEFLEVEGKQRFEAQARGNGLYAIWDNNTGSFDIELGEFPDFLFTQQLADELNRRPA